MLLMADAIGGGHSRMIHTQSKQIGQPRSSPAIDLEFSQIFNY
jgi:hypothetical protein